MMIVKYIDLMNIMFRSMHNEKYQAETEYMVYGCSPIYNKLIFQKQSFRSTRLRAFLQFKLPGSRDRLLPKVLRA
jgi:hypothetical protein